MNDLDDVLKDFYEQVASKVNLTAEQKAQVTGAGAKAYAEVLKDETPVSNLDYNKAKKIGAGKNGLHDHHLRDGIIYKEGYTVDNIKTGDTDIGWNKEDDIALLGWVNDGVMKMSPKQMANLHFVQRAQQKAAGKIADAMSSKLAEVINNEHD